MLGGGNSQAPDVDLGSVCLGAVEQLGRSVLGRATVRLERLVLLVDVAQTEVCKQTTTSVYHYASKS